MSVHAETDKFLAQLIFATFGHFENVLRLAAVPVRVVLRRKPELIRLTALDCAQDSTVVTPSSLAHRYTSMAAFKPAGRSSFCWPLVMDVLVVFGCSPAGATPADGCVIMETSLLSTSVAGSIFVDTFC